MIKFRKTSNQKYTFKNLIRNDSFPVEIHIAIPSWVTISVVLILMAATGKIGATIAFWIVAFFVAIYLIPDDF
ncbi:MAG: hypothetical protein G01um10147_133 [Microgenomates group bacterium Gr01-1014_7]|nr:MAG: hypothetical protein G01um10147_133 [Microgenomates group bacterium Gr01-1014_7]